MTPDQIRIIDPATIDFPVLVEAARQRLRHELGADVQDGCFAAGDLGVLAREIFAETPYGERVATALLEHAALPALGVLRGGPDARDFPLARQGCLLVFWRASLSLSEERGISFGYGMRLLGDWMRERAEQGPLDDLTWLFHPSRNP